MAQSDNSDRESSTRPPKTKSLADAVTTMIFHESDIMLTVQFEFSSRLAIP